MTSYNKVNGVWSHYNYDLVTTVLRKEWGFDGCVITDWWIQKAKSPEFPLLENNAYRVRAQVCVLMPGDIRYMTKEYKNDSSLLKTLGQPGGITKADLQRTAAKEAGLGERMALNRLDEMIKRFRPALESAAEALIHQGVKGVEALKAAILDAGSERYLSTAPTHHKELEEK